MVTSIEGLVHGDSRKSEDKMRQRSCHQRTESPHRLSWGARHRAPSPVSGRPFFSPETISHPLLVRKHFLKVFSISALVGVRTKVTQ